MLTGVTTKVIKLSPCDVLALSPQATQKSGLLDGIYIGTPILGQWPTGQYSQSKSKSFSKVRITSCQHAGATIYVMVVLLQKRKAGKFKLIREHIMIICYPERGKCRHYLGSLLQLDYAGPVRCVVCFPLSSAYLFAPARHMKPSTYSKRISIRLAI